MKLSDQKKEEIVSKLQQDIDAANAFYEEEIEPKVLERYEIYNADKGFYRRMFPLLSQNCELYTTDVRDTIGSAMPSLMKTFFGSSDVISIVGKDGTEQDNQRAQVMQDLINYELDKANSYMRFHQWIQDSLITNAGVLKVDWERTYKPVQQTQEINLEAYQQFAQAAEKEDIKILSIEPNELNGTMLITFETKTIDKNQPRMMNLLASEFRYSPDATSLEDCDFVAHRKIVSIDYLRKQEQNGMYSNVAELAENASAPHYTTLDTHNNRNIDAEPNKTDSGRKKVELYECYVKINVDDNPDALLTPMIITISNGVILRAEENTYERNPFFFINPMPDPHKIWPETGFVDLIAPIQHAKTAILRQMVYNMAQGNDSRMAVDTTLLTDVNDLLENRRYIRINGEANKALQPIPTAPLQSWTFNMLEYLDSTKENRTGITKYNQGMDTNSLNKTATGINIITQQANMRLEQIARTFAETGIRDLFRFLVKMNQLFISEETVIRLTNGPMQIAPDDLDGEFDLAVNAAMGTSTKQQNIQNLQMIEAMVEKLAQVGLAGPQQFYNMFSKIVEELGYKNADNFVMNPQQLQQQQQQQQAAQQAQEAQEAPPEPLDQKVSVTYDDLPWQAQMQLLKKMGFDVNPEMFTEKTTQDALKEAVHAHAKADATSDHARGLSDVATAKYLQQMQGGNVDGPEQSY